MKAKELLQLTDKELHARIGELRGKIRDLRFTVKTRQQTHVRDIRSARKDLARALMIAANKKTS